MPTLALNDLGVRRGPSRIVDGLQLTIRAGTVFWVVGPNGAGKTSLLRVLAGLDAPADGVVLRRPRPGAPFRYFHSEMALPGWSSVGAWHRLVRRLRPDAHPPTALRPDLAPGRWVRRLSTGERKRLLLDALLRVPGSLLLDEPYEHLSPDAKVTLSALLRERARTDVVVVVTNQATHRGEREGALRLGERPRSRSSTPPEPPEPQEGLIPPGTPSPPEARSSPETPTPPGPSAPLEAPRPSDFPAPAVSSGVSGRGDRWRRSAALARYALAGNLRTPYTWAGAGLMALLALFGLYASSRDGRGWVLDFSLLFDGAILAAIFSLRSGLIAQRKGGLQTFLRVNFMSPVEHMTGAILSLLGCWLLVCAGVFVVALVLPGAGPHDAAWHATLFAFRTGVLVPFVLVAESATTIELPFFLPALAFMGLLMALVVAAGEVRALALLAPPVEPGSFRAMGPAAARCGGVMVGGFAAVLGGTAIRARWAQPAAQMAAPSGGRPAGATGS